MGSRLGILKQLALNLAGGKAEAYDKGIEGARHLLKAVDEEHNAQDLGVGIINRKKGGLACLAR